MIYKSEDRYYVKSGKHFTELEPKINGKDVTFSPTNNRVDTIVSPIIITFEDAKKELLNKDEQIIEEVIMEEQEKVDEEVETYKPTNTYNKYNKYSKKTK